MKKIKKIYFVGIKGVGMTPLAIFSKEAGIKVSGSDLGDDFITDEALRKAEIIPRVGFSPEDVQDSDLVITTGAHGGFDNPQVINAKRLNIPVWTQGQAVGEYMKGDILNRKFAGISVSGTHGKTTTTGMIATIFKENNLDPSYLIGTSEISPIGLPGHFGRGKYFIAEADEYVSEPQFDRSPKFLYQHPEICVILNIELDHPDMFESVEILTENFKKFTRNIDKSGILVICGDYEQNKNVIKNFEGNIATFGLSPINDYVIDKIEENEGKIFFWVNSRGTSLGEFAVNIPGEFNALNSLSAIVCAIEAGISIEKIKETIAKYKGSKRRFEYVGKLTSGAKVFDDYAHHPTEIKQTLKALRSHFKNKKVVCFFQPHTYSRTKKLFDDFSESFSGADTAAILEIYPSLREEKDSQISSKHLVQKMSQVHNNAVFFPDDASMVEYIVDKKFNDDFVLISMGAGDIYKIWDKLEFAN